MKGSSQKRRECSGKDSKMNKKEGRKLLVKHLLAALEQSGLDEVPTSLNSNPYKELNLLGTL